MNSTFKEEQRYKLNRLKEAIDAERLLQSLGFEIYRNTPEEIRGKCLIHGGSNKTSFRMNKKTKNWVCFSSGCHEDIGYDVISLVMYILKLSFPDAVSYLESVSGVDIHDDAAYVEFKREKERQEFLQQAFDNRQVAPSLLTEDHLNSFKEFRSSYFVEKGYSEEVLDRYEVGGGYVDKYGFQRDVIPIRDEEGILRAFSCRDITDNTDYSYKYLLTRGFDKDKVLYNLHRAKDFMGENKVLIVVEGFKSVWKLDMAGYKNVVACMGSRLTKGQQNLLYKHAFNVVLFFDADEAGVKGILRNMEEMRGKINVIPLFIPYEGKDPSDLEVGDLHKILGGNYV